MPFSVDENYEKDQIITTLVIDKTNLPNHQWPSNTD